MLIWAAKKVASLIRDRVSKQATVDFGQFQLHINPRDGGGRAYRQSSYRDELSCPLHWEIVATLKPRTFIDIGANYGFTALVHHTFNPAARIIAVEPSPLLMPYLEQNLTHLPKGNYSVIPAVCGDQASSEVMFALNLMHSQDSRVAGEEGWPTTKVRGITLAMILESAAVLGPVLIKIDTQGFEEKVLAGGWTALRQRNDWMIKMEFAPSWLRKHGADPVRLLEQLVADFCVSEWPKRVPYKGCNLYTLVHDSLTTEDAELFVHRTESLSGGEGWCDLLVRPCTKKPDKLG